MLQPACEMQQVISDKRARARGELAKPLSIEEIVGPGEFPALLIEKRYGEALAGEDVLHHQSQSH